MDCKACKEMRARQMREEHSPEWSVSKELISANKRLTVVAIIAIVLWFATVAVFVLMFMNNDKPSRAVTKSYFSPYAVEQSNPDVNCNVPSVNYKRKKKQTQLLSAV